MTPQLRVVLAVVGSASIASFALASILSGGGVAQARPEGPQPCGVAWSQPMLWTHAIADGLLLIWYLGIGLGWGWLKLRRRDLPAWIHTALFLFALTFILCGLTHWWEVWNLWNSNFWVEGWTKVAAAVVGLYTLSYWIGLAQVLSDLPPWRDLRSTVDRLRVLVGQAAEVDPENPELANAHRLLESAQDLLRPRN